MKMIFIYLSLLLLIISNCTRISTDEQLELAKYFKARGLENSLQITKDQFIDLIDYLMTKNLDPKESAKLGFRQFIPKHSDHVPDIIRKKNTGAYISEEYLMKIMNDYIENKFPGKQGEEMKQKLKELKENEMKKQNQNQKKNDL